MGASFALEPEEISLDELLMIKLHQTLSVESLDVEFSGIEDSRCPSDVTCIWEGRASVTLHIYNQTQYQAITLDTNDAKTFRVDSYEINLIDVLPYPVSTKDVSQEYVVIISVSKNTPEIVLPPLKQSKNGVSPDLINCKSTLVLIIKNSNGSPACVKSETKAKLFERGWTATLL
ncbi:MAG: hypothetical protein EXS76_02815 [Nitrosarchaeum sp.]|nr:hypothetical protein [Nitrosarchaeum sp.]